ncbi:MAG: hypothetical protein QOE83_906 [Actinomycetota bacterium]|nr:hypothetical protein [Actinomycetota bacterium]
MPGIEEEPRYGAARAWTLGIPAAVRSRRMFDAVEAFVVFVGYPRSGHSLVGSLINAHPEALIAHELDAVRLIGHRVPRSLLFGLLMERDREFASGGRRWGEWDYAVPGGSQGRLTTLRVIGDKKGGRTTQSLAKDPALIDRLARTVRVPLRIVHVIRDPFDIAARMSLRGRTVDAAMARLAMFAEGTARIRNHVPLQGWHDLGLERLIAHPRDELRSLLEFLSLPATPDYLEACASIILPSPHRTSEEVDWTPSSIKAGEAIIERYPQHFGTYRRLT